MKIGELAQRSGVSIRALRYYEERGLLWPRRTSTGYRIFDDTDVQAVADIRTLLAAGLGTDLISQILSCRIEDAPLLSGCRDRLGIERRRLTHDIDRLARARSMLDDLLADSTPEDGEHARRPAV